MYRFINPLSPQELPLRILFQPAGNDAFDCACEAEVFRGLVAAVLDDPAYETADAETRLIYRLRLADDVGLLEALAGRPRPGVSNHGGANRIDISSGEAFIHSLDRLGYVSLDPRLREEPRKK